MQGRSILTLVLVGVVLVLAGTGIFLFLQNQNSSSNTPADFSVDCNTCFGSGNCVTPADWDNGYYAGCTNRDQTAGTGEVIQRNDNVDVNSGTGVVQDGNAGVGGYTPGTDLGGADGSYNSYDAGVGTSINCQGAHCVGTQEDRQNIVENGLQVNNGTGGTPGPGEAGFGDVIGSPGSGTGSFTSPGGGVTVVGAQLGDPCSHGDTTYSGSGCIPFGGNPNDLRDCTSYTVISADERDRTACGTGSCGGNAQRLCMRDGTFGGCVTSDACAPTVTTGQSCAGMTRYSEGESSNGSFVGCSGQQNCFCQALASDGSFFGGVTCIEDRFNDSCAAPGQIVYSTAVVDNSNPPPVNNGNVTTTSTESGNNPPSSNPINCYVCSTGNQCVYAGQHSGSCPSGTTSSPTCNNQCSQIAQQCVYMNKNGSDPMATGVGNVIQFTLVYQHPSTTNPFPNMRLRVSAATTPEGRDAGNTTQQLVTPATITYIGSSQWQYVFNWEAANPAGTAVPAGTYQVRALTAGDDASTISTPTACTQSVTLSASAQQAPVFSIIKSSSHTCQANGSAVISYTVTVRNIGPVSGVITSVTDDIDSDLVAAGIAPANINPTYGTFSAGRITWLGTIADRTYTANQSKQFTYSVTIPAGNLATFRTSGVQNEATVTYDSGSTTGNTSSFNLNTVINCSVNVLPTTGVLDDFRFLLLGTLIMGVGLVLFMRNYRRGFDPAVFYSERILKEIEKLEARDGK